jgi:hypothetical protein
MVEAASLDVRSPTLGASRVRAWTLDHRPLAKRVRRPDKRRSARAARAGCGPGSQVRSTARQLDPGLVLTGPPPIKVFRFISQIEVCPLMF